MAGVASIENGKKGGRPKGSVAKSTREAIHTREYVVTVFQENLAPIVLKAVNQAIGGDKFAREWLSDQAWGKARQSVELTGKDGSELFKPDAKSVAIANEFEKKLKGGL